MLITVSTNFGDGLIGTLCTPGKFEMVGFRKNGKCKEDIQKLFGKSFQLKATRKHLMCFL